MTSIFAEGRERNKALGVWGAVAGTGAGFALLGGILTLIVGRTRESKAAISAEGQTEVIG